MLRLLAAVWVLAAGMAAGSQPPAIACERAALAVAGETGVPADILGALTLTETGRRQDGVVRPWAWSVNAEGAGTWFDEPGGALAFAEARVAQGRRNLDIGCFQINYRWHGQNFPSVAAMFDPMQNARYAARFLGQLYTETGDWRAAAAAFHSRSPAEGAKYLVRFDSLRAMLRQRGWGGMAGAPETYNQFTTGGGAAGGGSIAADRRALPLRLAAAQLDGGEAQAETTGGLSLAPGQEAPVPDMRGGGLPVDVSLGADGAGYGPADEAGGDPLSRLAQDLAGGAMISDGGDMATAGPTGAGGWQPAVLPGEEAQVAPTVVTSRRRYRASAQRVTLLGAPLDQAAALSDAPVGAIRSETAEDDGAGGAGRGHGSLALLGAARGPLLRPGRSLVGAPQAGRAADPGAQPAAGPDPEPGQMP